MKLSIIIPVYNTAEYLPKCLDSVICPGIDSYEIIIVNDGSTDSSKTVAESYVNRYPELIRLITTADSVRRATSASRTLMGSICSSLTVTIRLVAMLCRKSWKRCGRTMIFSYTTFCS